MIKSIIGMAASFGATQVTQNIVKATTPDNLTKATKVITQVGGFVLGMFVSTKVVDYTDGLYDDIEQEVKDLNKSFRHRRADKKANKEMGKQ